MTLPRPRIAGPFAWLNLIAIAAMIWLTISAVRSRLAVSSHSNGLLMGIGAVFVAGLVALALVVLLGDRRRSMRIFVIVFLSLGILEFAARWLRQPPVDDQEIFRAPSPYVMFTGKPGASAWLPDWMNRSKGPRVRVEMDAAGMRRDDRTAQPKRPGQTRIVMLGGSTVFQGTTPQDPIPAHIEEYLHEDGRVNVQVFNFGIVSCVSGQELSLLLHRVVDLAPDLVIVYDGGNDIYSPFAYDPRPGYPYNFFMYEDAIAGEKKRAPPGLFSFLASHSAVVSLARADVPEGKTDSIDRLRSQVGYMTPAWEEKIIAEYARHLEKMCLLARAGEFKLVAILQPMVHFKSPLIGDESKFLGGDQLTDYVHRQYDRIRAAQVTLQARHPADIGCHFVDLSGCLRDCPRELYWDLIHTDNSGNAIIARAIVAELRQRGLPPPPKTP